MSTCWKDFQASKATSQLAELPTFESDAAAAYMTQPSAKRAPGSLGRLLACALSYAAYEERLLTPAVHPLLPVARRTMGLVKR